MKNIVCKVHGSDAMIVGYAPGKKGRPMAIIITQGILKAVRLRDIDLGDLPGDLLPANPAPRQKSQV
jgi:hypothetical protein